MNWVLYILMVGLILSVIGLYISTRVKPPTPNSSPPEEKEVLDTDVMGKSKFDLCQIIQDEAREKEVVKPTGNTDIFAPETPEGEKEKTPEEEPEYDLDIDIEEEKESMRACILSTGVPSRASGLSFEEINETIHAVMDYEKTDIKQQKEAGRVLEELQYTDLFKQISTPDRSTVVSKLMNLHLSEYFKHHSPIENSEAVQDVPDNFSIDNVM